MQTFLIVVGVIAVAAIVLGLAWYTSGPRFQGRSRGGRSDYQSEAEQDALLHEPYNTVNQSGIGYFG
jgi:hypothetical protein